MIHSGLTFLQLREANVQRLPTFKNNKGQPAHTTTDGSDWTIAEWMNALAGEVGEACNIAKKIRRGDFIDGTLAINLLLAELADVVIYADHCAKQVGGDLGQAVVDKFNYTSRKIGSPIRLEPISKKS